MITTRSVAQAEIAAAIAAATDGDTVMIPAGTAAWAGTLTVDKAITLQGAGVGKSIILDDLRANGSNVVVSTTAGKSYRITGLEFRAGSRTPILGKGCISITGTSKSFRVDHCKFDRLRNRSVCTRNAVCGVIDHCTFIVDKAQSIALYHDAWDGKPWGDGSWATPLDWGGPNAVYIEDNDFSSSPPARRAFLDEYAGARFVFRNNKAHNVVLGSHGTGSTGRYRSVRQWEIYNNTFTAEPHSAAECIHLRGGTGVVFNNSISGIDKFVTLHTYRFHTPFPKWPGSDGTCGWDLNDPKVYASGTADAGSGIGPNNVGGKLVVAGATWTKDQWKGYTVRDLNGQSNLPPSGLRYRSPPGPGAFFSSIASNTSDTIIAEAGSQQPNKIFAVGDRFEIRKVIQGLDMIGASTGDLLSSSNSPTPVWLHQTLEPVYVWNNSKDGVANGAVALAPDSPIREGVHFFNNRSKPDYKPFMYPHPLVVKEQQIAEVSLGHAAGERDCRVSGDGR